MRGLSISSNVFAQRALCCVECVREFCFFCLISFRNICLSVIRTMTTSRCCSHIENFLQKSHLRFYIRELYFTMSDSQFLLLSFSFMTFPLGFPYSVYVSLSIGTTIEGQIHKIRYSHVCVCVRRTVQCRWWSRDFTLLSKAWKWFSHRLGSNGRPCTRHQHTGTLLVARTQLTSPLKLVRIIQSCN